MTRQRLTDAIDFVTEHTRITLLAMVLLSAVVVAGIPQLDTASQAGADADAFEDVDRIQKAQYVQEQFAHASDAPNRTFETVYVRDDDGNVLSKRSLLAGLRYQRSIRENASVNATLHDAGITGIENLVAKRAAGSPNATLDAQIRALDAASASEVRALVEATLANDPRALRFLPADHDPADATATDRRVLVALDASVEGAVFDDASTAIYQGASERSDAGFFVLNSDAWSEMRSHFFGEMIELVVPVALAFILVVLAFAYRDLVDVLVGMVGVVLSVLWMFGLLGWLGVSAGTASIVPVVLVSGLSIDFGFHIFNRYREQRGDDDIRGPMRRGVTLVATALVLVTVTAAIGFLANLTNPLALIRNLGVSITLGVVSALLIFVTVVPALKIGIDGVLERVGFDRRKAPLGHGRYLRPVLASTVTLARRGAPVVLVVAILVGAAGGLAWLELDEESYQQSDGEVAEWKQDLPGPLGWDTHPVPERSAHVEAVYQPASADAAVQEPILIEGDVTSDDTLEALQDGVTDVREKDLLVDQPGARAVASPVTAMHAVAERNASFAAVLERADTDGNGVPDRNLESVYDAFYAADEETASTVVERTESGEYEALLVTLALNADYADAESTVSQLTASAAIMADGDGDRTATVAGSFAVNEAVLDEIVGGILATMTLALAAIAITLAVVFRYMHGSATQGVVVAVPIALVLGLVIGGMYVLSIPLTLLTALLMSLVIGLGVDYNIHVGDRYADERRTGKSLIEALDAAVTGTGGALLGSTLTSAGAFATIMLVPHPQLESFGAIVVIAMTTAFVVSVLVLPSLLLLWDRHVPASVTTDVTTGSEVTQD